MSFYGAVNTQIRESGYRVRMMKKKPGAPKGKPKPLKRALDAGFPARLDRAMKYRPGGPVTRAELARLAKCTRAAIGNYLSGRQRTIEAFLLFAIADVLRVDPRWLLFPERRIEVPVLKRKIAIY